MYERKYVSVSADGVSSVSDVMQLILRLPYAEAIKFAGAVDGDVDKIADGALAWCEADDEEVRTNG